MSTKHNWPNRDEWARDKRTVYAGDVHEVRVDVSRDVAEYATPEQFAAALAELGSYWRALGKDVRAANNAATAASPWWRKRRDDPLGYAIARDELADDVGQVLARAHAAIDHRKDINTLIKSLAAGRLPGFTLTTAPAEAAPVFASIVARYVAAQDAAVAAFIERRQTAAIDDAAWQRELERRAAISKGPLIHRMEARR